MSKFKETFSEPVTFWDGEMVLDRSIHEEEAIIKFMAWSRRQLTLSDLCPDTVRFEFSVDPYGDGKAEGYWMLKGQDFHLKDKKAKEVWVVYPPFH